MELVASRTRFVENPLSSPMLLGQANQAEYLPSGPLDHCSNTALLKLQPCIAFYFILPRNKWASGTYIMEVLARDVPDRWGPWDGIQQQFSTLPDSQDSSDTTVAFPRNAVLSVSHRQIRR